MTLLYAPNNNNRTKNIMKFFELPEISNQITTEGFRTVAEMETKYRMESERTFAGIYLEGLDNNDNIRANIR